MSIIFELFSLVLQQFQQAFFQFEFLEAPIEASDVAPCLPWESETDAASGDTSWVESGWHNTGGADAFLFKHASAEDPAANTVPHDDERAQDITAYDSIVKFLMSGDSEAELAATASGFDLSFILGNPTDLLVFEL